MKNDNLQFVLDTLAIEAMLSTPVLKKRAQESGLVSSLTSSVKDYVMAHIDKENPAASVLAILTPSILSALGLPVLGFLVLLAKTIFKVDLAAIFSAIGSAISSKISGGSKTNSGEIDSIVSSAVMANSGAEPTEEDIANIDKLQPKQSFTLAEAKLFSYALQDFAKKNPNFNFENPSMTATAAGSLFGSRLATFIGGKNKFLKLLIFVLGWIVKVTVGAAGFMIAEDAVNKLLGRENAFDGGHAGKAETVGTSNLPEHSSQQVYKVNPGYTAENLNNQYNRWIVQVAPDSIGNAIVSWATDVYPGLKGKESLITSTNGFKEVVDLIKEYNAGNVAGMTFIPRNFTSRKDLVDKFMDEVAAHSSSVSPIPTPDTKKEPINI